VASECPQPITRKVAKSAVSEAYHEVARLLFRTVQRQPLMPGQLRQIRILSRTPAAGRCSSRRCCRRIAHGFSAYNIFGNTPAETGQNSRHPAHLLDTSLMILLAGLRAN